MLALLMVSPAQLSADAVAGRAIGALVVTGFGAFWMLWAFRFVKDRGWGSVLAIAVITAALGFGASRQLHRAQQMPHSAPSASQTTANKDLNRKFQIVLFFEWAPILAAVIIFKVRRRPDLIVPAIAIIVGLHFIPLAQVFATPLFYASGIVMALLGATSFAIQQRELRQAMVCVCSGAVLWVTAVLLLV